MKLAIAGSYDIKNKLSWSGTPLSIYNELKKQKDIKEIYDINLSELIKNREYKMNTYLNIDLVNSLKSKKIITKYGASNDNIIRSKHLDKVLKGINPDVVLQFGGFKSKLDIPYFIFSDSTHDMTLDFYKKYGELNCYTKNNNLDYYKRASEYCRDLYSKSSGIFSMSKWMTESLINTTGINSNKILTVNAAPNWHDFVPDKMSTFKTLESSKYIDISFVGVNFIEKGADQLVSALNILNSESSKIYRLHIAGINNLPISIDNDRIFNYGFVDKLKISNILKNSHLFVLPSRFDCFGIAFLEAMSYALPCIGRNICAMPEIIDEGVTGELVKSNSPLELAILIDKITSDKSVYENYSKNSYIKSCQYDWNNIVPKIVTYMKNYV